MLNLINFTNSNHKRSNTMFSQSISINKLNLISNLIANNHKSEFSTEDLFIVKPLEPYKQVDNNFIAFVSKRMRNVNLTNFIKPLFCVSFKKTNRSANSQFKI